MYRCVYSNNNKGPIRWDICNSYSTGGQEFMAINKQTLSSGYTLGLGLFTAINP